MPIDFFWYRDEYRGARLIKVYTIWREGREGYRHVNRQEMIPEYRTEAMTSSGT